MIEFINLTDEPIVLADVRDNLIHIPLASESLFPGSPTILSSIDRRGLFGDIPFSVRKKTNIVDLPVPRANRIYLVSGMISEFAERPDVFTASFTDAIRDDNNNIIANRSLIRYMRDTRKFTPKFKK